MYCKYYQAQTLRPKTWFVIGSLKSEENLAFTRTVDKKNSILEFFVTPDCEERFLMFMGTLQQMGLISNLKKVPNRLKTQS